MNTMHNQHEKRYRLLVITAASTLLFCSPLAASEDVVPEQSVTAENTVTTEHSRPGSVGVVVSGTSTGITTDYFEQATIAALLESGIFSGVDESEKAKVEMSMMRTRGTFSREQISEDTPYYLNIRVVEVDTPSFSVRMTVNMDAIWTLSRTDGETELMREKIHSTYTGAAFEGGIHGANRVRVAMEGASRENIRMGVALLESLDLEAE